MMGMHLTIDLRECVQLLNLTDMEAVYTFLKEMPVEVGMNFSGRPVVDLWDDGNHKDSGATGFITGSRGHWSIHTYPEKQYVFFDSFYCWPFNVDVLVSKVSEWFGSNDFDVNLTERGEGWDEI